MKSFFTFIFLLLGLSSFSQNDEFKGHVKSIKEKVIYLKKSQKPKNKEIILGGDYGEDPLNNPRGTEKLFQNLWYTETMCSYINFKKEFNRNGTLKSEIWFHKDNSKIKKYDYKYSSLDSITEIKEFDFYSKRYRVSKCNYGDYNIRTTSLSYFSDSGNYSYFVNYIDNKHNIIRTDLFRENGFNQSEIYRYNSKDKKIEEAIRTTNSWKQLPDKYYLKLSDSIGTTYITKKYFYDSSNNLIEIQKYNQPDYQTTNNLYNRLTFSYDSKNRLVESSSFNKNEKILTVNYLYDSNDFKIKESRVKNNTVFLEIEYSYKDKRVIEIRFTKNNETSIIKIHYEFDHNGNWIKQTKTINDKPLFIWKRKIEYFN